MPDTPRSPARCANEQHAWGVKHDHGKPLGGWECQICGASRPDNPQKTHDELRKMFPDPWSGGRFK